MFNRHKVLIIIIVIIKTVFSQFTINLADFEFKTSNNNLMGCKLFVSGELAPLNC